MFIPDRLWFEKQNPAYELSQLFFRYPANYVEGRKAGVLIGLENRDDVLVARRKGSIPLPSSMCP